MTSVHLVPLGPLPRGLLERLAQELAGLLRLDVRVIPDEFPMADVYDAQRDQFRSDLLIQLLERAYPSQARVLGVTESDLFIPVLTFVFGEAQLSGRIAVVSSHRLRNEVYGLPRDPALLQDRLVKESMHELGHTFGLLHCHNPSCVMQPSTYAELVDQKPATYCRECEAHYETFSLKGVQSSLGSLRLASH